MKKILFVAYGGGHANMVIPVIKELQAYPGILCEFLACTTASLYADKAKVAYTTYRNYLRSTDVIAQEWGVKLAKENHNPQIGLPFEESVAYLGLCFQDLVERYGQREAEAMYERQKRHAFLPLTILERVIEDKNPDLIVVTSSPKSEHAAVVVGKSKGIATLAMEDLFGLFHYHKPMADYFTLLSPIGMEQLQNRGVHAKKFFLTGNPAFDRAATHRKSTSADKPLEDFFKGLKHSQSAVFLEQAGISQSTGELILKSDADILQDLDRIFDATQEVGLNLLVRPHPNQDLTIYHHWLEGKDLSSVKLATEPPLYPLLNRADVAISYTSTSIVEAMIIGCSVVQLKWHSKKLDLPFSDWGMALGSEEPSDLPEKLRRALRNSIPREAVEEKLACEPAAPKVAHAILEILER